MKKKDVLMSTCKGEMLLAVPIMLCFEDNETV